MNGGVRGDEVLGGWMKRGVSECRGDQFGRSTG